MARPPAQPRVRDLPRPGSRPRRPRPAGTDPVAERMARLDEARQTYDDAAEGAWQDYRQAHGEAWHRYRLRVEGLAADYASRVEQIRADQ